MNTSKKTPARKAIPAVAGEVDTSATHVVLVTPKVESKAFFEFEFSEGGISRDANGKKVTGDKTFKAKFDASELTEAAQRLQTLVPQVLTSLSPEAFDEGMRRAVAVRSFLLESMTLVATTLASAKEIVDTAEQKFEWQRADHERQLEAEFPGWTARFHGEVVREDSVPKALDGLKGRRRESFHSAAEILRTRKGWDDSQLMELQDILESCSTVKELHAFDQALEEALEEEG